MFRAAALLFSLVLLAAVALVTTASADRTDPTAVAAARRTTSPTTIRFDGIGPVRLGMTLRAAQATGWIRGTNDACTEASAPVPALARPDGPKAAPGVDFGFYFANGARGKLTHMMFSAGARTELGIRPGVSTAAQMVARYRRAGFTVRTRYQRDFAGTFVDVLRGRKNLMTGFADGRVGARRPLSIIAIPSYFKC